MSGTKAIVLDANISMRACNNKRFKGLPHGMPMTGLFLLAQ